MDEKFKNWLENFGDYSDLEIENILSDSDKNEELNDLYKIFLKYNK